MTRHEQFIKCRGWIRIKKLVMTNSLRLRIDGLPREDQMRFGYVHNFVLISLSDEQRRGMICANIWRTKLGKSYKKIIDKLVDWRELSVKRSYWAGKNRDGFPMTYTIPRKSLRSGTCIMDFNRDRVRFPKPRKTTTEDEVSEYVLSCLRQLTIAEDLIYPPPAKPDKDRNIRKAKIHDWLCKMAAGDFSLTYGDRVGRLYHSVVMMPAEGRVNLSHSSQLVECDIRSCHPVLLLSLFTDPHERDRYSGMLRGDIYTQISDEMEINDRDLVKIDFQKVINFRRKTIKWMSKKYVYQFFTNHFPSFSSKALLRKDLTIYLQNLESEIMVQRLGKFCIKENLLWIPMHDGYICSAAHEDIITAEAIRSIEESIGFTPTITSSPINKKSIGQNYA